MWYTGNHYAKTLVSLASIVVVWRGVSNLWNGLMEWTDGMEYQLTKIDKTLHCGRGEVDWTVMYV